MSLADAELKLALGSAGGLPSRDLSKSNTPLIHISTSATVLYGNHWHLPQTARNRSTCRSFADRHLRQPRVRKSGLKKTLSEVVATQVVDFFCLE